MAKTVLVQVFASFILLLVPSMAQAESVDCKQETEKAVKDCSNRIQAAGALLSGLSEASTDCQKMDLENCLKACNSALSAATDNLPIVNRINKNLYKCSKAIDGLQASVRTSQNNLSNVASTPVPGR